MTQRIVVVSRWMLRGAAILMLVTVLWQYGIAISGGRYPPGHPWTGLSYLAGAASFWIGQAVFFGRTPNQPIRTRDGVLVLLLAVLYFIFTLLRF